MRSALTLILIIPITLGALVGFVVAPFVVGFMVAYEFIADHVDGAYRRNLERRKLREQT